MSFLGTNQDFNALASSSSMVVLDALNLYYDDNTVIQTTEEYDLYISGNMCTTFNKRNIEKILESAEGTFSYVLFLKKKKKVVIGTDKMGFYPLYYTENAHEFIFANFIPHIKHRLKKTEPNWDTWDELLNTRDILGQKTTIKGISRLKQGEKICFSGNTYSLTTFWRYEGTNFVTPEAYISLNNDLLSESMKILSANKMKKMMPLTGGHDSRRIAITACLLGMDIEAITQETFNRDLLDEDTLIASPVAQKLGIKKHIKLPQPDRKKQHEDIANKDYWCGFESHQHAWAVNIARNLNSNTIIYDGIIGDITINNHYFHDNSEYLECFNDIERTISLIAPDQKKYQLKSHLKTSPLRERIHAELEGFPQDCNQITLFKIFNHCRRNTSHWYTPFLIKGINVGLPYGYTPLFLQSLSLDKAYRLDTQYQLECMKRINNIVANIPSTREHHDSNFWKNMGAKKGENTPNYPSNITASDRIFSLIEKDIKSHILNDILLRIAPKYSQTRRSWYYEPLKRLSLFLEWLETDESHLPVLYKGIPPFVENTLKKAR